MNTSQSVPVGLRAKGQSLVLSVFSSTDIAGDWTQRPSLQKCVRWSYNKFIELQQNRSMHRPCNWSVTVSWLENLQFPPWIYLWLVIHWVCQHCSFSFSYSLKLTLPPFPPSPVHLLITITLNFCCKTKQILSFLNFTVSWNSSVPHLPLSAAVYCTYLTCTLKCGCCS